MPIDSGTADIINGIAANLYKIAAVRSFGQETELASAPDSRIAFSLQVTAKMVRDARAAVDLSNALTSQTFFATQLFSPIF